MLNEKIQPLPADKLGDLLSTMGLDRDWRRSPLASKRSTPIPVTDSATATDRKTLSDEIPFAVPIRKVSSLANVNEELTLFEELDIPPLDKRRLSTPNIKLCMTDKPKEFEKPSPIRDDLKQLMAAPKEDEHVECDDDDMPPLLQAITRNAKHDGKKEKLLKHIGELEEKEQKELEKQNIPLRSPRYPQPDTVTAETLPGRKNRVILSDVRVSERVCKSSITVSKHPTVYNDLLDEIDPVTVKNMDKNLFMGDEIREVYKEIMKTVPTTHLQLENDELIQPTADSVNLGALLMPSSLGGKVADKVVNTDLLRSLSPPWGEEDILKWGKTPATDLMREKSSNDLSSKGVAGNHCPGRVMTLEEYKDELEDYPRMIQERMTRNYASWLAWWKDSVSTDDYMKYLAGQESDFLGYIYHFYDSDHEDDEEDDMRESSPSRRSKRPAMTTYASHTGLSSLHSVASARSGQTFIQDSGKGTHRKQQSKKQLNPEQVQQLDEMKSSKAEYTPGMWNVNSILLGGLGKQPELPESELEMKTSRSDETIKTTKSGTSIIKKRSHKQASCESLKFSARQSTINAESERSHTRTSRHTTQTQSMLTTTGKGAPQAPTAQDRLERVWASLQLPDNKKLDMAIKYSSDSYADKLNEAIDAWEKATDLIIQREILIGKLENFERMASDPTRFFERGYRGSSVARLEEAKHRSHFYKRLEAIEKDIKEALNYVQKEFQDTISYQGRPYLEKMHWDKTEMLHWLQEERKQLILEREAMMKNIPVRVTKLEPVSLSITS